MKEIIVFLNNRIEQVFADTNVWILKEDTFLNYKPKNGGWSGLQILEHITLTSHFLLMLIEKGVRKSLKKAPVGIVKFTMEELTFMEEVSNPNSFLWIRPENMEPKGITLPEIKSTLENQKQLCLLYLSQIPNGEGTIHKIMMSVNNIGKINVYQYIYFLVLHQERHLFQLQKVWDEYMKDNNISSK